MALNITIALAVLGLALILRSIANRNAIEARNPFLVIVGFFLVLYIGAALFISYRMGVWSAETSAAPTATQNGDTRIVDEPLQEVDLSTGP